MTKHNLAASWRSGAISNVSRGGRHSRFAASHYWGVDVKPKGGRLKINSLRILEQHVIDIDTYGSTWKHCFPLIRNARESLTVFLTIGLVKIGGGNADAALLDSSAKINARTGLRPGGVRRWVARRFPS